MHSQNTVETPLISKNGNYKFIRNMEEGILRILFQQVLTLFTPGILRINENSFM